MVLAFISLALLRHPHVYISRALWTSSDRTSCNGAVRKEAIRLLSQQMRELTPIHDLHTGKVPASSQSSLPLRLRRSVIHSCMEVMLCGSLVAKSPAVEELLER